MTFLEIARRWTIVMLAETLRISVNAVETVLPFQPRWLAQIALLAAQLRAAADAGDEGHEDAAEGPAEIVELPNVETLLASHTCLRQGLSDIVARGLSLDADLLQRMRTDWSLDSVVSYLSSAEKNVRDSASRTLDEAAEGLGMSIDKMTMLGEPEAAAAAPAPAAPKARAKRVAAPARRPESVR